MKVLKIEIENTVNNISAANINPNKNDETWRIRKIRKKIKLTK
jgi:hypothetical protein